MISIMLNTPFSPANITKLVFAPASNMIASLNLLHDGLALFALSIVEVVLEEPDLLLITVPSMNG